MRTSFICRFSRSRRICTVCITSRRRPRPRELRAPSRVLGAGRPDVREDIIRRPTRGLDYPPRLARRMSREGWSIEEWSHGCCGSAPCLSPAHCRRSRARRPDSLHPLGGRSLATVPPNRQLRPSSRMVGGARVTPTIVHCQTRQYVGGTVSRRADEPDVRTVPPRASITYSTEHEHQITAPDTIDGS